MIQKIETTKNDFVNGVPRDMISVVLNPSIYAKIRNYLDNTANNANVNTAVAEFGVFHGVKIYNSVIRTTKYLKRVIDFSIALFCFGLIIVFQVTLFYNINY